MFCLVFFPPLIVASTKPNFAHCVIYCSPLDSNFAVIFHSRIVHGWGS